MWIGLPAAGPVQRIAGDHPSFDFAKNTLIVVQVLLEGRPEGSRKGSSTFSYLIRYTYVALSDMVLLRSPSQLSLFQEPYPLAEPVYNRVALYVTSVISGHPSRAILRRQ
jgi:hypothetical protein